MTMQLNGVQLKTTIGTDFNSQYGVGDTALTNNTTISNNPLYNLAQVLFNGKQTDNISQYNKNDLLLDNGLKPNLEKGNHKVFTQA